MLCLTGEVGWARLSPATSTVVSATPIALFLRANARGLAIAARRVGDRAQRRRANALEILRTRGASFARDLGIRRRHRRARVRGSHRLRRLRRTARAHRRLARTAAREPRRTLVTARAGRARSEDAIETQARTLLRRYGVIFRRLLTREPNAAPWRELARVYRRLEARGEIRGGRFVRGMSGEQFALPEAIERLREIRRDHADGRLIVISAADPLNLTGIITEEERIRAVAGTRIAYRDGIAVSVMEGDYVRPLVDLDTPNAMTVATALAGRRVPVGSGFVGRSARPPRAPADAGGVSRRRRPSAQAAARDAARISRRDAGASPIAPLHQTADATTFGAAPSTSVSTNRLSYSDSGIAATSVAPSAFITAMVVFECPTTSTVWPTCAARMCLARSTAYVAPVLRTTGVMPRAVAIGAAVS